MRKINSILFMRPDYHCSFFYRDQFRKLGWRADIFVNSTFPHKLLYSNRGIIKPPELPGESNNMIRWLNQIILILWWLTKFWRYQYHVYFGRPPVIKMLEDRLGLTKLFGRDFLIEPWLAKIAKVKLVYIPTGCNEEDTREIFSKIDNGNICDRNCGSADRCFDSLNLLNFARIRRYFDMSIGLGFFNSTQLKMTHMKYRSIDLKLWSPDLEILENFNLPDTGKLRILHTFFDEGRKFEGKNIKGSPIIVAAIKKLEAEGYPVEYVFFRDYHIAEVRYLQVQADIVVEELLYGMWGSTGVEVMALGKPLVTYLRPEWKEFFLKTFPEYDSLPIVQANVNNIYEVLKKLVTDADYRRCKGEESRRFAEAHFDPEINTKAFAKLLATL
jgi:glycosyltransferase involved in cell wall biosynthesis